MRKLTLLFVLLIVFFCDAPVFASEYHVTDEDGEDLYQSDDYLPQYIKDILNKKGVDNAESLSVSSILELLNEYINNAFSKYVNPFLQILIFIILISISKRIIDNHSNLLSFKVLFCSVICLSLLRIFGSINTEISVLIASCSELISSLIPVFTGVILLGGGVASSATSATSLAIVLSVFKTLLSDIALPLTTLAFIFMIIEHLSPAFDGINCTKHLKKWAVTLISFVTTMLLTVLSIQNVISARADSLSLRSVKFAASSFIPLVGNAVGESLKTVSNGVSFVKASIGASSSFALLLIALPVLCELFMIKIFSASACFFASACGCNEENSLLNNFAYIIDLFLSIIICILLLSFLVVFVFMFVAFGV